MSHSDYVEVEGRVLVALPNAMFTVQLKSDQQQLDGTEIVCYISGKIRKNSINILPGDRVTVAISTYDVTKGRITFRHKG